MTEERQKANGNLNIIVQRALAALLSDHIHSDTKTRAKELVAYVNSLEVELKEKTKVKPNAAGSKEDIDEAS